MGEIIKYAPTLPDFRSARARLKATGPVKSKRPKAKQRVYTNTELFAITEELRGSLLLLAHTVQTQLAMILELKSQVHTARTHGDAE